MTLEEQIQIIRDDAELFELINRKFGETKFNIFDGSCNTWYNWVVLCGGKDKFDFYIAVGDKKNKEIFRYNMIADVFTFLQSVKDKMLKLDDYK